MTKAERALLKLIEEFSKDEDLEVRELVAEMIDLFEAGQRRDCHQYRERIRGLCMGDNYALFSALAHLPI